MPIWRHTCGRVSRVTLLTAVLILTGIAIVQVTPVTLHAQNPSPSQAFETVQPGSTIAPAGTNGIVVEGVGGGTCAYPENLIEYSTLYFIQHGYYTWTEISPQSVCNSIGGYESEISDIVNYIEAYGIATDGSPLASKYWLGIMIDEEYDWGFSASTLGGLTG